MFRIEFFVDDKKLPTAMHALVGISHGPPTVTPVVNAVATGNGLAARVNGDSIQRVAEYLKRYKKGTLISAGEHGVDMMKALGLSPDSKTYMLSKAAKAGLLRKTGKGSAMKYTVV